MIRKTVKIQKRIAQSWDKGMRDDKHFETVVTTTLWFLFVPIYRTEYIKASTI